MNPKELWQVLYESYFAVSNSSTEYSAMGLINEIDSLKHINCKF